MNWEVDLTRVEKWFQKLTDGQAASVSKELWLLRELGPELRLPHSRALGSGLFELRERAYGFRLYYYFDRSSKTIIIVLRAGSKTSQQQDINKARKEMP